MTTSDPAQPVPSHVQLWQMATGHWVAHAIHVAAEIGVADHLASGPVHVDDLARKTGTHAPSLYRLLRALSSLGIFRETSDRMFEISPLAEPLASNAPNSVRYGPIFAGQHLHWSSWGALLHSVKTGESACEHVHGEDMFSYLSKHPDEAAAFNGWMSQSSDMQVRAVLPAYDFSPYSTIADIGGGQGRLLAAILEEYPQSKGILFDSPHVVAHEILKDHPVLSGRYEVVGGNFFQSVPSGADLYVLKYILHDWSDELSVQILTNCRNAMTPESGILLIEMVLPEDTVPHPGFLMDLNMMVLTPGGVERRASEYQSLFKSAGIAFSRIIPTSSPWSLVEGIRK